MASYEETIEILRAELDAVDERLLQALADRMRLSREIAQLKAAEGRPIFDPAREEMLLNRNSLRGEERFREALRGSALPGNDAGPAGELCSDPGESVRTVYLSILRESRRLQRRKLDPAGQTREESPEGPGSPEETIPELFNEKASVNASIGRQTGNEAEDGAKTPLRGKYGLLGAHLGHSWSPQLHKLLGLTDYTLHELESEEALEAFLRETDSDGLNVTIPYKKAACKLCARLSDGAKAAGVVNTLRREADGTFTGFNTDLEGFRYLLRRCGVPLQGRKAVVLGSGGAGSMAAIALREAGADTVILSRGGSESIPAGTNEAIPVLSYQTLPLHRDAVLLVNATPLGMAPREGDCPVDPDAFPRLEAVVDLIYHPLRTRLLLEAEQRGIPAFNGLPMLVAQAVAAQAVWRREEDIRPDPEEVERICATLRRGQRNIVLIGMPGSGKSTQGFRLAKELHRPFFDSDTAFQYAFGLLPEEYIVTFGEEAFREEESALVRELGRLSGAVIATGGGAVLREENRRALKQNGFLVFLDRPANRLAREGRPLSLTQEKISELEKDRLPLYRSLCDAEVRVSADSRETARRLRKALEKA